MAVQGNQYYAVGGGFLVNDGSSPINIIVLKLDSLGNEIEGKNFGDTLHDWYSGNNESLSPVNSGGYILGSTRINRQNNHKSVLLTRFNENLDTLWAKSYIDTSDYVAGLSSIQGRDGNFYVVGTKKVASLTTGMLLIKTDTSGNLLSRSCYSEAYHYIKEGYNICNTFDGGFLLGGGYSYYNYNYSGDWDILHVDSSGFKKDEWLFGNPNFDDATPGAFSLTKDSGYLFSGGYVTHLTNNNAQVGNGRIVKMDKNFNVVLDRQYQIGTYSTGIRKVLELNNGDLVAFFFKLDSSQIPGNFYNKPGWGLIKLNAQGNEIWRHTYYPFNNDSTINMLNIYTLNQTPDGGFILSGTATKDSETPAQQMWVVKTDSMGCDGSPQNCDTTTQVESRKLKVESVKLNVFPNPAREFVTVGTLNSIQGANIIITDLLSKVVYEETIQQNTNYSKISVKNFPEGVYIVKVQGKGFVGMEKFLKW